MKSISTKEILELESTEAVWTVGLSAKSASVSEEATLRLMEFLPPKARPSVDFLFGLLIKAMVDPTALVEDADASVDSNQFKKRPAVVAFLSSEFVTDDMLDHLAKKMVAYQVRVTTIAKIGPEMDDIMKKRRVELFKKEQEAQKKSIETAKETPVEFAPPPPRGCFQCKTDIAGKASQCSACKAIIYCSPDCAVRTL